MNRSRSFKKRTEMYAYFVALILFYRKYLPVLPCMWLLHLLAFSPDVWFNVRHILLTVLIMIYDPVWNVAEQLISRE